MTRKLSTPFAVNSTLINEIPVSQTNDSQASYDIGFPVKNFQTIANGGVAVDGKDFNGLFFDITGNIVDLCKGLPQYFDSAYSTLIGGYPLGSRLCLGDNSGYVISTIDNNTNDPNSSMTGWVKQSNVVDSVSSLRSTEPSINKIVQTTSYYSGLNLGGATYYYDSSDTSSTDDGIFTIVTSGGARWKLRLQTNEINIFQCGIKADATDEGSTLNSVISKINAYCSSKSTRLKLNGLAYKVKTSTTIIVDVNYINLCNLEIYVDTSLAPSSIMAILKIDGSLDSIDTTPSSMSDIVIRGVGWRTTALIVGVLCSPSVNANLLISNNIRVLDCNYGLALGSNTYLVDFRGWTISRCRMCLVDSITAGLETSISNSGENISFSKGAMGDSLQIAKIIDYNNGSHFAFHDVSFDYSGGGGTDSYVQFELSKGQYDFFSCHFESGNSNDRINANYFNVADYTNVNFYGGWIIFNSVNTIPYFFYCTGTNDDRAKDPHINMRDTWVYAPSVNWWANRGLDYFKPNVAVTDYTTSGKWQELNTMMTNGDMSRSSISDAYYASFTDTQANAGETVTDSQTNSLTTVSFNSSAKAVEMKRLKQTSSDATNGGIFYLLIPRQPSRYNPHVELSYKTDVSTDISSGNIYITASPVRWSGQVNKYGTPINLGTIDTIGSARISSLTTDGGSVSITNYASQRMDYKNANYVLITVNMSSLINKVNFQVTDIKVSQAD
jgi:hypothetical protein